MSKKKYIFLIFILLLPFIQANPMRSILPWILQFDFVVIYIILSKYLLKKFRLLGLIYIALILDIYLSPILGVHLLVYFILYISLDYIKLLYRSPSEVFIFLLAFIMTIVLAFLFQIVYRLFGEILFIFSLKKLILQSLGTGLLASFISSKLKIQSKYIYR